MGVVKSFAPVALEKLVVYGLDVGSGCVVWLGLGSPWEIKASRIIFLKVYRTFAADIQELLIGIDECETAGLRW